jgi:hypothetical protein
MGHATFMTPWGKYPNYRDIARFEYGRLLWKNPEARRRLLAHWESPEHPHSQRFDENKCLVCEILESPLCEAELDADLRQRHLSLRAAAREIPPVFGSI